MRIIKTVIRRSSAKLLMAGTVLFAAPAASLLAAGVLPEAVGRMTEAAKFSVYPLVEPGSVNNGDLILYTPILREDPESVETQSETELNEQREEQGTAESVIEEMPEYAEESEYERYTAVFLSRNITDAREDLSAFSADSGDIREVTFTPNGGPDHIQLPAGGQIRNCTELSGELVYSEAVKPHGIHIELYSEQPQVLILHTHTNESYEPVEKSYYDESYTCRSEDPCNSVVAVGTAIAEELASAGIAVLHDGTVHDGQYNGAYERSLSTAEKLLEEFPSIKIILDIHRDAIEDEDGTRVSAVTEIDGKKAAQVMIISAADDGSYDIPFYMDNLRFASALQQSMEQLFPTLTRPVLFQYCQYNQQLSTGSLLIEVGSHGNSVEQAVYSGRLIGRAVAAMFTDKGVEVSAISDSLPELLADETARRSDK